MFPGPFVMTSICPKPTRIKNEENAIGERLERIVRDNPDEHIEDDDTYIGPYPPVLCQHIGDQAVAMQ